MITATSIGPNFADNQLRQSDLPCAEDPQLTETVRYDAAPWIYRALIGIHEKERTGTQVSGVGDFRVDRITADAARQAVACVTLADLPAPSVLHMSGTGLSLIWVVRERRIEFDVFPQGEVTLSTFQNDRLINTDDMLEIREGRPVLLMRNAAVTGQFEWLLYGR